MKFIKIVPNMIYYIIVILLNIILNQRKIFYQFTNRENVFARFFLIYENILNGHIIKKNVGKIYFFLYIFFCRLNDRCTCLNGMESKIDLFWHTIRVTAFPGVG